VQVKDFHNNCKYTLALAPVIVSDNTAQVGLIIDRAGFAGLELVLATGTLADADATFAVTVDHGNQANLSDAAAVPANQLLGTTAEASFTFAADNTTKKIGYIGDKRYVRLTITPANNAAAAPLAVVAVQGGPLKVPQ
jgi:hypothetical protein